MKKGIGKKVLKAALFIPKMALTGLFYGAVKVYTKCGGKFFNN